MKSFIKYLNNNKLIKTYENKQYVNRDHVVRLSGYKKASNIDFDGIATMPINKVKHISVDNAFKIIKTRYNKRNPEVINIHNILSITGTYHKEAITLKPLIDHLNNKQITYELQHTISEIGRKIDLFIPKYNIAIECDENNHIDRDPDDQIIRDYEMIGKDIKVVSYNPDEQNFDIELVIKQIDDIIGNQKLVMATPEELQRLLEEYNEGSLEKKYYEQFGQSIIGDGFVVDFDNVWKLCGYSLKKHAKYTLVKNFQLGIDYIVDDLSSTLGNMGKSWRKENIFLSKETFKCFCIMADTPDAKQIRKWYIKMESNYKSLLEKTINLLQQDKTNLKTAFDNKCIEKKHERKQKQQEYKQMKSYKKTKESINNAFKNDIVHDTLLNNIICKVKVESEYRQMMNDHYDDIIKSMHQL